MTNRYLQHEDRETHGALRPKTIVLTERQIEEIEELVREFSRGHNATMNFSSFVRLMIECGRDGAIERAASYC
jgi:hypothetical protein